MCWSWPEWLQRLEGPPWERKSEREAGQLAQGGGGGPWRGLWSCGEAAGRRQAVDLTVLSGFVSLL